MSSAKELHRIAMESLQKADNALLRHDIESYNASINKALDLESSAAMLLKDKVTAEPTRSVLFRSAASIAINCGKYQYADWLIIQALRGNPPQEIKNELSALAESIFFRAEAVSTGKRIFDIIFSASTLFFLLPLFSLIFVLMKMDSKGPVFARHIRMGLDNKVFYCFKFRLFKVIEESDVFTNEKRDITRIGYFLYATGISELPQLFNVLKGDMSTVGPYPMIVHGSKYLFSASEFREYNLRQMVMPGLTGFKQVAEVDKEASAYNEYVEKWSILLDLKIIFSSLVQRARRTRIAFK